METLKQEAVKQETPNVRERGACRWFDAPKGYGFVRRPDGSDIFVHYSSLVQEGYKKLDDGQLVEYTAVKTPKGWAAQEGRSL